MKKWLRSALVSLVLTSPAAAVHPASAEPTCPPTVTAPTPQQVFTALRQARDRGALWTIDKDGRQSWLYGTIHLGNLETSMPGPKIREAIGAADLVALELDLGDPSTLKALQAPEDASDSPQIPPTLLERLKARAEKACVPWDSLSAIPPVLIVSALTVLEPRWDGLDPAYASERVLSGIARAINKPVVALESAEVHRKALMSGPPEQRIEAVERGVTALEQDRVRPLARRVAKAWQDGDLDTIANYEQWCGCVPTEEAKAQIARTVLDRNPDLAAAIDTTHREGKRVFAATGILHMTGERGLPALLEKMGYTVSRVRFDAPPSPSAPSSDAAAGSGSPSLE